ncbi:heparinase II/III family protein [Kiritimatiellota bacterium B12222]|nr:heparinase II/III family protein [Kiritimatiellota bacterium B12222]
MKALLISLFASSLCTLRLPAETQPLPMQSLPPHHPRLFITAQKLPAWREQIAQTPFLQTLAEAVILKAEQLQDAKPLERTLIGRRLLEVSRTALKRIVIWSTAYQLTGESAFAERGIQEMLTLASFSDWNPDHFLDVAEITAAMAIGYDTLYPEMSETERTQIAQAILEKGLRPSLPPSSSKDHWWVHSDNNWNQVCNASMTLAALALYEQNPERCETILHRAIAGLPQVLKTYAPDGAYVEGASYWSYGTTFNILFLDAVEHALGTDFGLGNSPGFLESSDYLQHISGPSQRYFNYADSGSYPSPQPAVYWMAQKRNQPSLLWGQAELMQKYLRDDPITQKTSFRLVPFILFWAPDPLQEREPTLTHWQAGGSMPVAFHRSDWSDTASYVAIKGGSPSLNHAHMDVGSFVMEMNGVRWAIDLGGEDYHQAEKRGLTLWDSKQESDRWTLFRVGSFSHNILTVNGEQQRVTGHASILSSRGAPHHQTVVDLDDIYTGQLASAQRTLSLDEQTVLIEDQITTLDKATHIRWAMLTNAEVTLIDGNTATLSQQGQTLEVSLSGLPDARWHVKDVTHPPRDWESINKNTRILYFEADLIPAQTYNLMIKMQGASPLPETN